MSELYIYQNALCNSKKKNHVIAVCVNNLHYLQQTKDNIQNEIYNILR